MGFIGKYINRYVGTDIRPVGVIVGVRGKKTLIVERVRAVKNKTPMNIHFGAGGFSVGCGNWVFETDKNDVFEMRLSKEMLKTHKIEDDPKYFYDYNF